MFWTLCAGTIGYSNEDGHLRIGRLLKPLSMDPPPLQSPSNQHAHDKIRGYAFQCWLTVDAWLRLQPDDRLYVECAEDFAVVSRSSANVAQAKAVAASISLRSDDAVEALNHLWAFQQAGLEGGIRYSFLTTGGFVVEKGNPFDGVAGIALWQKTAADGEQANAEKLRHFLATDIIVKGKLDAKLAQFLATATAKEFFDKFVARFVWDTGRPDETEVRAAVEGRLAAMAGRDYAASPLSAGNLADSLFTAIVTVASSKEKIALTRATLLATIQTALVPQANAVLAARQQEAFGGLVAAGTGVDPEWAHTSALPPIQPADEFTPRTETLANLKKKIGPAPFAVFTGSTGMGKTTLAQLYSASEGGIWLQFRAKDERRAVRVMQECMALMDQRAPKLNLIVDDLPWERLDGAISTALRGFALMVRRGGGRALFTNQRPPTAQELAAAGMAAAVVVPAPALTRSEVVEVALRLGCPQKDLAEAWAIFVLGHTLGHPQLVHAQLIGLKAREWPKLSAAELQVTSKDVHDERARRQILLADLAGGEVEFLQRVSVYFGTFRRDQALKLAQQLTPIPNAGASFERLRGPWIELVVTDYYQLSPLIHNSLLEGTADDHVRALHTAAVKSVTSTLPVQAADACNALYNAVEGLAADEASGILTQLLCSPSEHASTIRQLLHWAIWIKADGSPIFRDWPAVDLLFRLLQFEVASEMAPGRCASFLTYCDAIIAAEQARDPKSAERCGALMAFQLIRIDAPTVPIDRLFWCARVMKRESIAVKAGGSVTREPLPKIFHAATPEAEIEFFVSTRILSEHAGEPRLQELLTTLEQATPEDRAEYLVLISRFKPGVLMAFDRLWLAEEKKTQRSWDGLLALYDRFLTRAVEWKHDLLMTAAVRASAIIQHEYLNDVPAASALLNRVVPVDPELVAVLDEQRGNIALFEKLYADAQGLFEACFGYNIWSGISDGNLVNCRQKAGTAAGHRRRWAESAAHFETGSKLAAEQGDQLRAFALSADGAFARWQNGDKALAVTYLVTAMELTPQLPDPGTDLAALRALKCFGHMIYQLAWRRYGRTGEEAGLIVPGMCSDPRPNPALKELPPPLVILNWLMILWLDFEHTPNSGLWEKMAPILRESPLVMLRHHLQELEARRLLAAHKYRDVFRCAVEMAQTFARMQRLKIQHLFQAEDSEDGAPDVVAFDQPLAVPILLLPALTLAIVRQEDPNSLLNEWREAATGTPVEAAALAWLEVVGVILEEPLPVAYNGATQEPDLYLRWAHAMRILKDDGLYPEALLAATMYFALLPYTPAHFGWFIEMTKAVDEVCSKKWLAACEHRCAFRSPTLFIPDLKGLAANPTGSLAHLAELALAARPALSINVPDNMIEELKRRARAPEETAPDFFHLPPA